MPSSPSDMRDMTLFITVFHFSSEGFKDNRTHQIKSKNGTFLNPFLRRSSLSATVNSQQTIAGHDQQTAPQKTSWAHFGPKAMTSIPPIFPAFRFKDVPHVLQTPELWTGASPLTWPSVVVRSNRKTGRCIIYPRHRGCGGLTPALLD